MIVVPASVVNHFSFLFTYPSRFLSCWLCSSSRKAVSTLRTIDVLSPSWNVVDAPLPVSEDSAMLIFFNVAGDPSILSSTEESRARLHGVLGVLAAALHPRGSMAIAIESTCSTSVAFMEGEPLSFVRHDESVFRVGQEYLPRTCRLGLVAFVTPGPSRRAFFCGDYGWTFNLRFASLQTVLLIANSSSL